MQISQSEGRSMGRILDLRYLEPDEAERLVDFGVASTDRLLLVAAHKKGREDLSQETGIAEERLLHIVHLADMMRVKGIGSEYSDLLDQAGVQTLAKLEDCGPDQLHQELIDLNEEQQIVRRVPSEGDVRAWVDGAQSINSIVST